MLLDRKRINRIARWFAIGLAIIFALSAIFLGVGSGTGNIFAGCDKGSTEITAASSFEEKEQYYQDLIQQNPQDKDSMLQLVSLYSDQSIGRYNEAIFWLNKYLEQDPKNVDVRLRIARIQMDNNQDYAAAVVVLNEATSLDPSNANAFLLLGQAAKSAGQNQTAILAWSRYLELAPSSEYASLIRDEITKLATQPAVAPTTSTVPGTSGIPNPTAPATP